jgi:hypothetical protein
MSKFPVNTSSKSSGARLEHHDAGKTDAQVRDERKKYADMYHRMCDEARAKGAVIAVWPPKTLRQLSLVQ